MNAAHPNPNGIAAFSPGLARQRLPWVRQQKIIKPERLVALRRCRNGRNPVGVGFLYDLPQGSLASSATLGCLTESRWDSQYVLQESEMRPRPWRLADSVRITRNAS